MFHIFTVTGWRGSKKPEENLSTLNIFVSLQTVWGSVLRRQSMKFVLWIPQVTVIATDPDFVMNVTCVIPQFIA